LATAGLFVLVGSFWLTLGLLDRFSQPADPDADLIKVTQATYGRNCQGYVPQLQRTFVVKAGNVTDAVSASCSVRHGLCTYVVDVNRLGDPAPGCSKDMTVEWRCGSDQSPHTDHLNAEANTQTAYLRCP
jgi:hypothetical protein